MQLVTKLGSNFDFFLRELSTVSCEQWFLVSLSTKKSLTFLNPPSTLYLMKAGFWENAKVL